MPEPRGFKSHEPEEGRTGYEHLNEFQVSMKAACHYIHARVHYTLANSPIKNATGHDGRRPLPAKTEKA